MTKKKNIKESIINIIALCLFIMILITVWSTKNIEHEKEPPPTTDKEVVQISNEEQCLNKLTDSEKYEIIETFLLETGENYKKNNTMLNVCEEYHKIKEDASDLIKQQIPAMNFARGEYQETISLPNNDVLIIGGNEGDIKTVELFNNKKKTFQVITDNLNKYINPNISVLKTPFYLNNNSIYYQGAVYDIDKKQFSNNKKDLIKKIDDFDKKIASKQWQDQTNLTFYKLFDDGKILFANEASFSKGCKGLYLIDPVNNKKYLPGNFKYRKNYFTSVFLKEDTILIIGGYSYGAAHQLIIHYVIDVYNPITGKISLLGKLDPDYKSRPSDLPSKEDRSIPLVFNNNILLIPYNHYLCFYDLKLKKIVKRISLTYCPLKYRHSFKNPSLYDLMYPIDKNKLLFAPKIQGTQEERVCLLDLNGQEKTQSYELKGLLYPYQKLTPLNNGGILVTGGIEYQKNKPNIPFSNKAYLLKVKH